MTIVGAGFAEPSNRNVVIYDGLQQVVLSGDSTYLVVRMEGATKGPISVAVPGGLKTTSAASFVYVGRPCEIIASAGDGQTGTLGATLKPMSVRVVDECEWTGKAGEGVPGVKVFFVVVQGEGSLSQKEAITDDDGVASTILSLGQTAGVVKVEVEAEHLNDNVYFTATATSP